MPTRITVAAAAFALAAALAAPTLAQSEQISSSTPAPSSVESDVPPSDPAFGSGPRPGWFSNPRREPSGLYVRTSGMWVDPQNDARLLDGSGTVDVGDDIGFSVAIGQRALRMPISLEFEYSFRRFETDDYIDPDSMLLGDNRITQHTLALNLLYDQPNIIGPVGLYAGAGVGANLSELRFSTTSGAGSVTQASGEGFFWQTMAGVTVSFDERFQLYGGVRWSGGDDIDDGFLRYDVEAMSIEFGLRYFF